MVTKGNEAISIAKSVRCLYQKALFRPEVQRKAHSNTFGELETSVIQCGNFRNRSNDTVIWDSRVTSDM